MNWKNFIDEVCCITLSNGQKVVGKLGWEQECGDMKMVESQLPGHYTIDYPCEIQMVQFEEGIGPQFYPWQQFADPTQVTFPIEIKHCMTSAKPREDILQGWKIFTGQEKPPEADPGIILPDNKIVTH